MKSLLVFGVSAAMSLLASAVIAWLYVWPWLKKRELGSALQSLVAPHVFLRFIGLSFLIPGVVSPGLPAAFANPAAFGDLIAGVLAIVSIISLAKGAPWRIPVAWLFNIWGAADFLFAFYQGPRLGMPPESLGAGFFIPTAIVPPLLVTHFLMLRLLTQRKRG